MQWEKQREFWKRYLVGKLPGKDSRAIIISSINLAGVILVGANDLWVGMEKIVVVFDIKVDAAKVFPVTERGLVRKATRGEEFDGLTRSGT